MSNDKRFTRDGYKIWDNVENEEFYELHYRYECDDMCRELNKYEDKVIYLIKENEQLKKENERLKHDNQVLIQFKNITIKTLQGVKDNNGNNDYTSALMDSIANELGEDLE